MTSSTTGDRRWGAAARRSGMTVLGKVTVPKPINLPSQRLENQGNDPNVEIVPKGTLSWGCRTPSNPWGSSTLSPHTGCGLGPSGHLSTRPSSGGSGTQSSTAGSDGGHEPMSNVWASNSRPSSASGLLTSDRTSGDPLRPRSAETRPGSSPLSRIAEPVSGNSGAWGAPATAEKLGVLLPSRRDGFSLSSGDFPSLGSERAGSGKNTESPGRGSHARPGSSSGRTESHLEDAGVRSASSNSWTRDGRPAQDGLQISTEDCQVEPHGPHQYPNTGVHHQQFDTWRGPPVNNHPGVWYRGPPGGPPYGPPVAAAGFPLEPFPYYRPQVPPPLANPPSIPPPGAGPPGNLPQGGDLYRPPMPDAYMRPSMPIRPGFYPGPVAYDGYYCPPMGYRNPNERDVPYMGMPSGPSGYHRYPVQNTGDPVNSFARSGGHGPPHAKSMASEHVNHSRESQEPYRVLLKPQEACDRRDEGKGDGFVRYQASDIERESKHGATEQDRAWEAGHKKDIVVDREGALTVTEGSSKVFDHSLEAHNEFSVKKPEMEASVSQNVTATLKASSLIQKIEGLNAKARISTTASNWGGQTYKTHTDNNNNRISEAPADSARRIQTAEIVEPGSSRGVGDTVVNRRLTHGMRSRIASRGKGRHDSEESDGWQKKAPESILVANSESSSNVHAHDISEAQCKPGAYPQGGNKGESVLPPSDSFDSQDFTSWFYDFLAQRAMMRELALQRAKQRKEEEEERAREQKAKAFAKLEELNRRTQTDSVKTVEAASGGFLQNRPEDSIAFANPPVAMNTSSMCTNENDSYGAEGSTSSNEVSRDIRKTTTKEDVLLNDHARFSETTFSENIQNTHDGSDSKQKHVGSKQQHHSISIEKNLPEKSSSTSTTEALGVAPSHNVANEVVPSHEPNSISAMTIMTETTAQPRKKNNRSGKKKHKAEGASSICASGAVEPKETDLADTLVEGGKLKVSKTKLDYGSVQSVVDTKDAKPSIEQRAQSPKEETHGRATNQLKSQHTRRNQRNAVANRSADKFHGGDVRWAPVRAPNKSEVADEVSQNDAVESVVSVKDDNQQVNNPKTKRSELERYVPKPVAKEMAQHAVIQQAVAPVAPESIIQKVEFGSLGSEISQSAGLASTKPVSALEHRNGQGRQIKHGKGPGSWRQRSTVESTRAQVSVNVPPSEPDLNGPRPVDNQSHHHIQDGSLLRDNTKNIDECDSPDGWKVPEGSEHSASTASRAVPVGKEPEMTGHSKWQGFRGHRGMGNNHADQRKGSLQHAVPEASHVDVSGAPKDNRGIGDRSTSHWQPKSQTFGSSNQRGNRSSGTHRVEGASAGQKDSAPISEASLGSQPLSDKNNTEEASRFAHQEPSRPQVSHKRQMHHLNQNRGGTVETVSFADAQVQQRPTSGHGRSRNQNVQSRKGHESRGDWGSYGQDDWNHKPPSNRDRPRHNSHYEYQPVGKHNNDSARDSDQHKDGNYNFGPGFREKGQGHPRAGGGRFYNQHSGRVRGDGGYE